MIFKPRECVRIGFEFGHRMIAGFNTDQGSQFTSIDVIKLLKGAEIRISMDDKGAWRDNVFIERLHAYSNTPEARAGLGNDIKFYTQRRPHASPAGNTPDQAYFSQPKPIPVAA